MKKYEILMDEENTIEYRGKVLHRIKALQTIGLIVTAGEIGGYIESESNLSQEGECWVADDAKVYGKACVSEDAYICENVTVFDNASVKGRVFAGGNVKIFENATVSEDVNIKGHVSIHGNAKVKGNTMLGSIVEVYEDAKIMGRCVITTFKNCCEYVRIHGNAFIYDDIHAKENMDITE